MTLKIKRLMILVLLMIMVNIQIKNMIKMFKNVFKFNVKNSNHLNHSKKKLYESYIICITFFFILYIHIYFFGIYQP